MKLADFLHTYLERRFSLPQMVAEWAYNLNDACMRYSHDEAINMFASILNDEVSVVFDIADIPLANFVYYTQSFMIFI